MASAPPYLQEQPITLFCKLKGKEDPQTVILYLSLVAIPIFLPLSIWKWVTPNAYECLILVLLSLLTQLAQYFLTRAHQASQASHIVHYNYLGVIGAVIFGWLLFHEALSPLSLIAIGLITACIFLINYYKKRA
ncbi:MAG: EamA family transporter [Bdellovibrionota bacterium]